MEEALDFRDVLIKPKFTQLYSRSQVNLLKEFSFKYSPHKLKCVPIMAANMDTVGTLNVMKVLAKKHLFTVLHKFTSIYEIKQEIKLLETYTDNYAFSMGMGEQELKRIIAINELVNFKVICIDVANGYMEKLVNFCKKVRETFPDKIIIAGNVVCGDMTKKLILEGMVDIVKVGIGGGSACTTRIKTGVGMPQLSAIMDCQRVSWALGAHMISDGGITCPGDLGKAFGAGADFVMVGGQFSGHDENPGEIIKAKDGKSYKLFWGMSSSHAMKKNYGGVNNYRTSEGRCIRVKYRGKLEETVDDFLGGLRSLCTYINCSNLDNITENTTFVKVKQQFNSSLLN